MYNPQCIKAKKHIKGEMYIQHCCTYHCAYSCRNTEPVFSCHFCGSKLKKKKKMTLTYYSRDTDEYKSRVVFFIVLQKLKYSYTTESRCDIMSLV